MFSSSSEAAALNSSWSVVNQNSSIFGMARSLRMRFLTESPTLARSENVILELHTNKIYDRRRRRLTGEIVKLTG